jgi:Immunity protein 35
MITKDEARAAVEAELASGRRKPGEFVVMDEFTVERSWGWVFFYNSRRFVETRDPLQALGGNAPYIVDRTTGEVRVTGTARPTEEYIAEYEASLRTAETNS